MTNARRKLEHLIVESRNLQDDRHGSVYAASELDVVILVVFGSFVPWQGCVLLYLRLFLRELITMFCCQFYCRSLDMKMKNQLMEVLLPYAIV